MPYIDERDRDDLRPKSQRAALTPGELNFQLTSVALDYMAAHGGVAYDIINDVMGAFIGAALEFYRRVAAPYEDKKINVNGDVFPHA
jgi:hypothetical protein